MSALFSTWELLTGLDPRQALLLAEWHLLAVLAGLGLLAAFGLHWLLGDIFRLYRRGGQRLWYMAVLTLPLLLVSVAVWLGCYLLGMGAGSLAEGLTRWEGERGGRFTEALGEALLAPALDDLSPAGSGGAATLPPPAAETPPSDAPGEPEGDAPAGTPDPPAAAPEGAESGGPPGGAAPADPPPGGDALAGQPADRGAGIGLEELAERLEAIPPETLRAALGEAAAAPTDGAQDAAVLAIARNWLGDPDQTWPEWSVAGLPPDPRSGSEVPLDPAEFVLSLVEEVGPEAVLLPADWAYIAGVRFQQRVLIPLLSDRFRVAAIVLASGMGVLDLLLFWGLLRLRRGKRPPAKKRKGHGTDPLAPPSYLTAARDKPADKATDQDKPSSELAKAK